MRYTTTALVHLNLTLVVDTDTEADAYDQTFGWAENAGEAGVNQAMQVLMEASPPSVIAGEAVVADVEITDIVETPSAPEPA